MKWGNYQPTKTDRIVQGIGSSIIFTALTVILVMTFGYGVRSNNSGIFCNDWYCLIEQHDFESWKEYWPVIPFLLVVYFVLGYCKGFDGGLRWNIFSKKSWLQHITSAANSMDAHYVRAHAAGVSKWPVWANYCLYIAKFICPSIFFHKSKFWFTGLSK